MLAGLRNEHGRRLVAFGVFTLAALISLLVLGFAGRGQSFKGDEWGYAHNSATESLPHFVFVAQPGKYLLVLPMLLYRAAFSTIGIAHYLPFRLAGIGLTIIAAALFLVLAARRVGYLVALPGAVLILFLGSANEVTATAVRITEQIAVIAGLGALLALERPGLRRDLLACLLLVISVTSHPLGLAFAAAATVLVIARRSPERWRRAWVYAVPLALFGVWFLIGRDPASDNVSLAQELSDVPRFEFQSLAVMTAGVTGAFRSPFTGLSNGLTPVTYVLATLVLVGVGLRVMVARPRPMFWALLAGILVLFAAPSFAPGALRTPDTSRYVFAGAIMLMLVVCEAFRGATVSQGRVRIALAVGLAAAFGFAVYSNATVLDRVAHAWADKGTQVRAELTALNLARDRVAPDFQPEDPSLDPAIPYTHSGLTAKTYFTTEDAYGSPAFSPEQLRAEPQVDRQVADIVLAHALNLQLRPIPETQAYSRAPPPTVIGTGAKVARPGAACLVLKPGGSAASTSVELPRGGAVMSASGRQSVRLTLGRFETGYGYPVGSLRSGQPSLLLIPADAAQMPWRMLIGPTTDSVRVCGVDLKQLLKALQG